MKIASICKFNIPAMFQQNIAAIQIPRRGKILSAAKHAQHLYRARDAVSVCRFVIIANVLHMFCGIGIDTLTGR